MPSRRTSQAVAEALKSGKHYTNRCTLSLVVCKAKRIKAPEIVIAVKKKIGAAVVRNKIRRRVYAAFSGIKSLIRRDIVLVIFPMVEAKNRRFRVLCDDLVSIFKEAELFQE